MFCRKCGSKILDDSIYCSKCGVKVEQISKAAPKKFEIFEQPNIKEKQDDLNPQAQEEKELSSKIVHEKSEVIEQAFIEEKQENINLQREWDFKLEKQEFMQEQTKKYKTELFNKAEKSLSKEHIKRKVTFWIALILEIPIFLVSALCLAAINPLLCLIPFLYLCFFTFKYDFQKGRNSFDWWREKPLFPIEKKILKYEKYMDIVYRKEILNVNDIAKEISLSRIQVEVELKEMLLKGYLPEIYFDENTNSLVITDKMSEYLYIICDSCGSKDLANKGEMLECLKCGHHVYSEAVCEKPVTCGACGSKEVINVGDMKECQKCGYRLNSY